MSKTFMDPSAKSEWEVEVALGAWHGIIKLANKKRDIWNQSHILILLVSMAERQGQLGIIEQGRKTSDKTASDSPGKR